MNIEPNHSAHHNSVWKELNERAPLVPDSFATLASGGPSTAQPQPQPGPVPSLSLQTGLQRKYSAPAQTELSRAQVEQSAVNAQQALLLANPISNPPMTSLGGPLGSGLEPDSSAPPGRSSASWSSSIPHFPIIPASQPLPDQSFQTALQVQSILSLPTPLLLSLARTNNPKEQHEIASNAAAAPYLPAMALPPPSPRGLVFGIASSATQPLSPVDVVAIGDHPAIPLLLGQGFCPPTPGIQAPLDRTGTTTGTGPRPFEPVFASVEDWSRATAKTQLDQEKVNQSTAAAVHGRPALTTSHSFLERELDKVAGQMKTWALNEQQQQVQQQVLGSRQEAVLLATQVAARKALVGEVEKAAAEVEKSGPGGVSEPLKALVASAAQGTQGAAVDSAVQNMDLGVYAETYRVQLDALASGYFTQLHKDALSRLVTAAEAEAAAANPAAVPMPGSKPPSPAPPGPAQSQAMHIQAAAAAAVAANAMAAKEMTFQASSALASMGVNVPALLPDRPSSGLGLARLEVAPGSLAVAPVPQLQPAPPRPLATYGVGTAAAAAGGAHVGQGPAAAQLGLPPVVPSVAPPPDVSAFLETPEAQPCTPQKRDYLLSFAHSSYNQNANNPVLLPLLHALEKLHPRHLPTLLLMSCVYYTKGEYNASLYYNQKLLEYDPTYVEAMSNIGTTMRATGRWREAEQFWWKAIQLRPTYWDATENLLGVLCNPAQSPTVAGLEPAPSAPRYQEALKVCSYVECHVFGRQLSSDPARPAILEPEQIARPRILPASISPSHAHRVMNLFYAKGNLRIALGDPAAGQDEYEKAVEVGLALPAWARGSEQACLPRGGISTRDLVVTVLVLCKVLNAFVEQGQGSTARPLVAEVIRKLGVGDREGKLQFETLAATVRNGGDAFVARLLQMGGGVMPTVLIEPHMLAQLAPMLFHESGGQLPALLDPQASDAPEALQARAVLLQSTNQTMSTMLLTLAKMLQDSAAVGAKMRLSLGGIPPSSSLLLPLYYLALALHPSPSTCNNLGILLSTLNATFVVGPQQAGQQSSVHTAQQLALKYYQTGLALDPHHPHLYTNIGSLLKDMGSLPQAIAMYKKAVECNPNFDVALANLANAIKDSGQIQDSIQYYQKAVQLNPDFPEAVAGLVNALGGVCDWKGRGGVREEVKVDEEGMIHPSSLDERTGYLSRISDLVAKQLDEGLAYGAGSFAQAGDLDHWLRLVTQAIYGCTPDKVAPEVAAIWTDQLEFILGKFDRRELGICEGGFLIRLVERLIRRIQRRWYLTAYGQRTSQGAHEGILPITVTPEDAINYRKPALPPSLGPVAVPTVLPFHTFTLPVTAREERLISHRTGLRISHSTLQQPWLPMHVFPPPPPPVGGRLRVGYVSSDLGNHPLSHLMQSVFGMHDKSKYEVFVYATSPSDQSPYRQKIEAESEHFYDVSGWTVEQTVARVVHDGIHCLVNLSGYTKGARNEVFAARPAPVQLSFMGFAGTLSAGWCDYFIVDPIVCPPSLVSGNKWRARWDPARVGTDADDAADRPTDFPGDIDPEDPSDEFVYTEKLLYLPSSYFVTDHRQNWREDPRVGLLPGEMPLADDGTLEGAWAVEEDKRWRLRKQLFPQINDETVIFANFNQLYKIDPYVFRLWLTILEKHPNSILWLLRFPAPGEAHLKRSAAQWAGQAVADRVVFTDVANKSEHVHRGRVVDLFLDTTECNAHTTLADILWSGTPVLTFPRHRHKMASRVGASIAAATGLGDEMIVGSREEYKSRALRLAASLTYEYLAAEPGARAGTWQARPSRRGRGELSDLRRRLFLAREEGALFDTQRWVRNLEKGLRGVWERWVGGGELEDGAEWVAGERGEGWEVEGRGEGSVWVVDDELGVNREGRRKWFE